MRRALPTARVGGPDSAGSGGKFTRDFLEHCLRGTNYATGKVGTPIDFVSFHAKGAPRFVEGHVRMGIAEQLRTMDQGFAMVASFPELKDKPVVIGESDPDGCAACQGPQLGYRNGTMYSSYTAASFVRAMDLADRHGVNLAGALTWAFEFEDQPYFAGFRALASNGIDLPVLNVFRMFAKMGGKRVAAESDGAVPLDEILKSGVRGDGRTWGRWPAWTSGSGGCACSCGITTTTTCRGPRPRSACRSPASRRGPRATRGCSTSGSTMGTATRSPSGSRWAHRRSRRRSNTNSSRRRGTSRGWGRRDVHVERGEATLPFELPRRGVSLLVIEWK